MTNFVNTEAKAPASSRTYSLSDSLKHLSCMLDDSGYETTWVVDGLVSAIAIEGETFGVSIVGD